jgi:two-component system chemotaxis response regulator CheY
MTTILIIDDSQLARNMVSGMVRGARPDFNMPGMDGLSLSCELHQRFPDLDISILTANVQDSIRRKVTDKGFRFVEKPITQDKMRELLASIA